MSPRLRLLLIVVVPLFLAGVVGLVVYLRTQATRDLTPSQTTGAELSDRERAKLEAEETARVAAYPMDSDGDGLTDDQERELGTDPTKADSDGDGFHDFDEVTTRKSDPTVFDETKPDERPKYGTAVPDPADAFEPPVQPATGSPIPPSQPAAGEDVDGDGLLVEQELKLGTDPKNPDSDGDGLDDGVEVNAYRTNPRSRDSDADGYPDADEIKNGYNPIGAGRCGTPDCRS